MAHPAGEAGALLCAGCDGAPAVCHRDHLYFSTDWLRTEIKAALAAAQGSDTDVLRRTLVTLDRIERGAREGT